MKPVFLWRKNPSDFSWYSETLYQSKTVKLNPSPHTGIFWGSLFGTKPPNISKVKSEEINSSKQQNFCHEIKKVDLFYSYQRNIVVNDSWSSVSRCDPLPHPRWFGAALVTEHRKGRSVLVLERTGPLQQGKCLPYVTRSVVCRFVLDGSKNDSPVKFRNCER